MTDKINIIIPLEGGKKWEREFNIEDKIQKVADEFTKDNNMDIPEQYIISLQNQNKPVNYNDPVKTLIPNNNVSNLIFDINLNQGLDFKLIKTNNYKFLGKPLFNPFRILVYDKNKNIIKTLEFDKNELKKSQIENYLIDYACCNVNDHLYISGGENKQNIILNNLWDIDLENKTIEKISDNFEPKKNHSMINISNKYIFIVGGNSKKVFYYDIDNKVIYNWGNLNFERTVPSLIQIDKELYCFDNLKKGDNDITFEKTNLKENPKWELIKPKYNENFNQKFFGVSKLDNDNILFVGGYMALNKTKKKLKNFKYNITNNQVSESDINFIQITLTDKNYYKLDYKNEIFIPDFNIREPTLIILNKEKKKIYEIQYELIKNKEEKKSTLLKNSRKKLINNLNFNMPKFNKEGIETLTKLTKYKIYEDNDIYRNNKYHGRNKSAFNSNIFSEDYRSDNLISTSQKSHIRSRNSDIKSTFSGSLFRNSVIKNNAEGSIKFSKIPKIKNKKKLGKLKIVENIGDFNKDNILSLKQSVNMGIGGKKQ